MNVVWERLREYARFAWKIGAYGLLAGFWGVFLWSFYTQVGPRLGYLTAHRAIANDLPCDKPECDFSVFWPAGHLAREHAYTVLYTPELFVKAASAMLLPGSRLETFFYPPTMLLPLAAISHLPFEWAYFVWTFGMALLAVAVLRLARLPWLVILAAVLSPAALLSMKLGQVAVLGDALLVMGLILSAERPRLSGGAMALLVCKPQIGILAPVVLVAQRNWLGLAAYTAVVGLLLALVTGIFGPGIWGVYLTLGHLGSARVLELPFQPLSNEGWGVSVFWMLRSLHASVQGAFAAQTAASLAAVGGVFWLWARKEVSRAALVEMSVFLSLLATPFGYSGEMTGYCIVLAAAAQRRGWRIGMLDALLWLWPGMCLVVSVWTGVLLTPLVVLAALAQSWRRAGLPVPHLPGLRPVLPRAQQE